LSSCGTLHFNNRSYGLDRMDAKLAGRKEGGRKYRVGKNDVLLSADLAVTIRDNATRHLVPPRDERPEARDHPSLAEFALQQAMLDQTARTDSISKRRGQLADCGLKQPLFLCHGPTVAMAPALGAGIKSDDAGRAG
jgi:hypothetical protein